MIGTSTCFSPGQSCSNEHIKPETTEDPAARCTPASSGPETLHGNRPIFLPFLPQECALPHAWSVKAVRFAPVNANYAALTARPAKRGGPPRRAFASFENEKMYSVKEVSYLTGWSCDTIRRLIYRGHLKAVILPIRGERRKREYRSARIPSGEVIAFLKRNTK